MKPIAFFDFDGTVTKGDTFFRFIFFKRPLSAGLVFKMARSLPVLAAWKLGVWDNSLSKEKIFGIFFKGTDENVYRDNCSLFVSAVLPKMTRREAMEKIEWHRHQQHTVVIVSASVESYISLFAAAIGVEYIATRVEIAKGKLSGKFIGRNCYGIEKVYRIRGQYDLSAYEMLYAYGDTEGDKEMLAMADRSFYRHFNG